MTYAQPQVSHHLSDKTEHSKAFWSPNKVKSLLREQETEYWGIAKETLGGFPASLLALLNVCSYLILIIDLPRLSVKVQYRKPSPD